MLRKLPKLIAVLPPIVANMVIVPFVLIYAYGVNLPVVFLMITVGIGEVVSCGVLGTLMASVLEKYRGRIFSIGHAR